MAFTVALYQLHYQCLRVIAKFETDTASLDRFFLLQNLVKYAETKTGITIIDLLKSTCIHINAKHLIR